MLCKKREPQDPHEGEGICPPYLDGPSLAHGVTYVRQLVTTFASAMSGSFRSERTELEFCCGRD